MMHITPVYNTEHHGNTSILTNGVLDDSNSREYLPSVPIRCDDLQTLQSELVSLIIDQNSSFLPLADKVIWLAHGAKLKRPLVTKSRLQSCLKKHTVVPLLELCGVLTSIFTKSFHCHVVAIVFAVH